MAEETSISNPVFREQRLYAEAGDKVAAEFLKKEEFEIKLPDLRPYVSLECPDGRRGIEVGLKGTF